MPLREKASKAGQHTTEELGLEAHVIEGVNGLIVVGLDSACGIAVSITETLQTQREATVDGGGRAGGPTRGLGGVRFGAATQTMAPPARGYPMR